MEEKYGKFGKKIQKKKFKNKKKRTVIDIWSFFTLSSLNFIDLLVLIKKWSVFHPKYSLTS